jgi:hypothetical protein
MRADLAVWRRLLATGVVTLSLIGAGCVSTSTGSRGGTGSLRLAALDVRHDARLLAMLDARRADTLLIDTLLRDADPDRRARTALAIGQLRMRARFPQLRRLLTDGDTLIAANAAFALGVAKDTQAVAALARDSESETEVRAAGNKKCGAARERSSSARPTRRRRAPPRSPAGAGAAPAKGKERAGSGKRGAARARGGTDGGKNVCGGGGLV